MSDEGLPQDFINKLKDVVILCEEQNTPPKNLDDRVFAPDDLQENYDELMELVETYDEISRIKVLRFLENNVEIDPNRESRYYLWDLAVVEKNGIVFDTYPDLSGLGDQDLKTIPENVDMNKDGFEYDQHYLIFVRRLASNYYLVGKLNNLRDSEINVSVPISYSKLGLPDTTREMILAAHWRGPETIEELRSRSGSEFFVQKGTESYQHGLQDRTEFYFEFRDGNWHLQIEELLPRTGIFYSPHTYLRDNEIRYYTRYLHAIVDEDCMNCFHLDGALRGYSTSENFVKRHTSMELQNPNPLKRISTRHKLFQIDSANGAISDYGEIAGLFFKHNPHVQRFFEGDSEYARELEDNRASHFRFDFERDQIQQEISA